MRRLLPAALATALAAALVLLAGCSDGDDPEPKIPPDTSSAAGTPSTSPTPSGPVEPTLPPEAAGDDAAAAEAFVRFYWGMVNYAQATGDVDGLTSLAAESCTACAGGVDWIRDVHDQNGLIEGGQYAVDGVRTRELFEGDSALFEVFSTVSTTDQVVSGTQNLDKTYPAKTSEFRFILRPSGGQWIVERWDLP